MKTIWNGFQFGLLALLTAGSLRTFEALQGPTERFYWDKTNARNGNTWFGGRCFVSLFRRDIFAARESPGQVRPERGIETGTGRRRPRTAILIRLESNASLPAKRSKTKFPSLEPD